VLIRNCTFILREGGPGQEKGASVEDSSGYHVTRGRGEGGKKRTKKKGSEIASSGQRANL